MVPAALGGCWWPVEVTPPWMHTLSLFLPTGWAMDAMHTLISFGSAASSALPHVIGLSAAAGLVGVAGLKACRYQ
jgi:ABC-type multidrug transport system permease subunit